MEGVWEFWEDQCLFRKLRSMWVWKDHHCLEYSQLHSPGIARWESLPKHPHFQPNTPQLFFNQILFCYQMLPCSNVILQGLQLWMNECFDLLLGELLRIPLKITISISICIQLQLLIGSRWTFLKGSKGRIVVGCKFWLALYECYWEKLHCLPFWFFPPGGRKLVQNSPKNFLDGKQVTMAV